MAAETQNTETSDKAAEDLALIRQMMEAGKKRVAFNGMHLVIWGILLMAGFNAQFLAVKGLFPGTIVGIWVPVFILGWGAEFFLIRETRETTEKNLPVLAYATSWIAVGMATLVYFVTSMISGSFDPKAITLVSTSMIGAAFFITAAMTGVRWLNAVAAGWWGLMAFVAYIPTYDAEMLQVMASASGLLLALPGFILRRLALSAE